MIEGLEPREPRRQLGQNGGELPDGEPQQRYPDEPHEQQRLSPCPEFRRKVVDAQRFWMEQIILPSGWVSTQPAKSQPETAWCW